MNSTRVPVCPPHTASRDPFQTACTACGVRLLDGISIEQLIGRVEALTQEPVQPTGRIRGTWTEVLEEGDGELFAYWVRPARNFAGYEAIECANPDPTGVQLSGLLLAELAGLPAPAEEAAPVALPAPSWPARAHRKASRWSRFKKWSRRNGEREFLVTAAPLVCMWGAALWVVLGNDGIVGLWSALF